jgi:hypothetical protein
MEICKNKKTNKAFVYLDEEDDDQALLITPQGEIKALENKLFAELIDVENAEELVSRGQITMEQYSAYNQYHRK